ncbi:baseplate J/gp47 family protein [Salmonella enterica subsp. enterica]|uniref:baseplate J/gp47 family protein n=1 Tax=Salmonella bongori TaxID=54736 RepID=UPI000A28B6A3|nr:baseplate J/gp47 family protein [Salmonella bongori]EAA5542240.1 baseplate J/gp47 family protein [Salmonella enterica subsp. enterica serovar Abony]EBR9919088.1 baseplate J/gp47 family protein [Salmonella enterica subsp. enterica serovar Richmond]EBS4877291.1 baseplate J/gp47 family protein [Salmonella enterica subsp. enterica serovar Hvittingfoss]EBV3644443.1 phage tail protein [Salmonella enterica subsp. enterica serovar Kottbus]ECZ0089434.1 baseplate J/gp47 family protein [Salmonella ent
MAFITKDLATIRDDLLRDLKNLLPDADISEDSDFYARASSVASVAEGLYQHQSWIVRQIFPDTADSEYLLLHARTRGLSKRAATTAEGIALITGAVGSTLSAGSTIQGDDVSCTTLEDITLTANTGTVKVRASLSGTAGNISAPVAAELVSAPAGINSRVTIQTLTGGTDEETDASLLARLLDIIRRPPAGGNRYDYRRWALECDGVTGAYVYPLRRGLGTVDIAITSAGSLPSESVRKATQAHIDDVRPVTAKDSLVLAPTQKTVDFDIIVTPDGILPDTAKQDVIATVKNAVARIEPGQPLIKSQIEMLISLITGITDRKIVTPADNVEALVDKTHLEWLVCGNINVRLS